MLASKRLDLKHLWFKYDSGAQAVGWFDYPGWFFSQFSLDFNVILVPLSTSNCLLLATERLSPAVNHS